MPLPRDVPILSGQANILLTHSHENYFGLNVVLRHLLQATQADTLLLRMPLLHKRAL